MELMKCGVQPLNEIENEIYNNIVNGGRRNKCHRLPKPLENMSCLSCEFCIKDKSKLIEIDPDVNYLFEHFDVIILCSKKGCFQFFEGDIEEIHVKQELKQKEEPKIDWLNSDLLKEDKRPKELDKENLEVKKKVNEIFDKYPELTAKNYSVGKQPKYLTPEKVEELRNVLEIE